MKQLYKFTWYCGRMGNLEGIFVAHDFEVEDIVGKNVYFGEVLEADCKISGVIKPGDINVLTDDQDFIQKCERYHMNNIGYNPLDYYEDEE